MRPVRPVAVLGGVRIPFCRQNTAYADVGNLGMSVRTLGALVETFGYDWADIRWLTVNAMKSAFLPFDQRLALINEVIKPGFAGLVP